MKELERPKTNIEYQDFKVGAPQAIVRVDARIPPQARESIFWEMEENLSAGKQITGFSSRLSNLEQILDDDDFVPFPNPLVPLKLLFGEKSLEEIIKERKKNKQIILYGLLPLDALEEIYSNDCLYLFPSRVSIELNSEIKKEFIKLAEDFVYSHQLYSSRNENASFEFNQILLDNAGKAQIPTLDKIFFWNKEKTLVLPPEISAGIKIKEVAVPLLPDIFRYTVGIIDQRGWRIEFDQEKFNQRNPRG